MQCDYGNAEFDYETVDCELGPCNVIMETWNVKRGPWNVNRGPGM